MSSLTWFIAGITVGQIALALVLALLRGGAR